MRELLRVILYICESEALDEAAGEKAGASGALQGSLIPAVLTLLVHKNDVALLQLDLGVALGRIRHHGAISAEKPTRSTLERRSFQQVSASASSEHTNFRVQFHS